VKALEAITKRIDQLLDAARNIDSSRFMLQSPLLPTPASTCAGWLAAADHLIRTACPSPDSAYRFHAQSIFTEKVNPSDPRESVASLAGILRRLKEDISAGLLVSLENRVSGETFDDLLEHAEQYLTEKRKEPAAVIAGVVFEDTIRRVCRLHQIDDAGKTLEPMINALKAKSVLSKIMGKSAVAAADLRTSATHARWDEFTLDDVAPAIAFTRRLIRDHLDAV
jgi:hypothetical protein